MTARPLATVEPADAAALLAELTAEVRALRSEVAALRVPRLAPADCATLARLLPAIREAVGPRVFSIGDLAEHARLPTPEALALRDALGPLDAGATRRLGKLFARALGVHVEGLLVQHVGEDRDGATWMIGAAFPAAKLAAVRDVTAAARSTPSVPTNRKKDGTRTC